MTGVITSSDIICIVGSQSPLSQSTAQAAVARGLKVVLVTAPGSAAQQGCEMIFAPLSNAEAIRQAVAARYPVVQHLVVAPSADPLASGERSATASQDLAAFMTGQVRLASSLASLVQTSGTIALAASSRCVVGSELESWFSKGLVQVSQSLTPRRVFLVVPTGTSGDTWLAAVSEDTVSSLLHPDSLAPSRMDAAYRVTRQAASTPGELSDEDLMAALGEDPHYPQSTPTQPSPELLAPAPQALSIDELLKSDTPLKPARTTAYDEAIASHADELSLLRRSLAQARTEYEQLQQEAQDASARRESDEQRSKELNERLALTLKEVELNATEVTRLDDEINSRLARQQTAQDALASLGSEVEERTRAVSELTADATALQEMAERALEAVRNGTTFNSKDFASVTERIAARIARAEVAGQELEVAEANIDALRNELSQVRVELESTTDSLETLRSQRDEASRLSINLDAELVDLKQRHETALERTLTAESHFSQASAQLEDVRSQLDTSREQLVSTEQELAKARDGVITQEREMAALTESVSAVLERQQRLAEELATKQAESVIVNSELSKLLSEREGILTETTAARKKAEAAQAAAERERALTEEATTEATVRTAIIAFLFDRIGRNRPLPPCPPS